MSAVNCASTPNGVNGVFTSLKGLQDLLEDQVLDVFPHAQPAPAQQQQRNRLVSRCPSPLIDPASIPKVLRRNSSFENILLGRNERRVCVIYTGGTIGMVRSNPRGGLVPVPNMLEETVRKFPHLHDEKYARLRFGNDMGTPLVLPEMHGESNRVTYTIYEYDPLLDSTNMTMDDWIRIAEDIKDNYETFDGFVVLHGTDTMSYTASALSFMMEHLGKSIVITGSQIPLFESRSDGRDNFLGALILAATYNIPEVSVYFGHKLFRGNRVTKVSSDSLNAFDSPNMGPLAVMGINIEVDYNNIFRPRDIAPFRVHTTMSRNVGLLRLFPSITAETVRVFLRAPTQGVVLQTYGAGNFPTNRADLLEELKSASNRGVLIINCTQCGHGSVSAGIYETGLGVESGVIPGFDMTPEAALSKLSYVLGRSDWDLGTRREMLQKNLRGELTKMNATKPQEPGAYSLIGDAVGADAVNQIVKIVATSLGLRTTDEFEGIKGIIGPALSCALVAQCSQMNLDEATHEKNLNNLFGTSEAQIAVSDFSGRTPLHFASSLGDKMTVDWLLRHGASVHVRDRMETVVKDFFVCVAWVNLLISSTGLISSRGYSALRDAIEYDRHDVIVTLRRCGAHLTLDPPALGAELAMAASKGDITRLKSYGLAGASLGQPDPAGRTALHAAVEAKNAPTVRYLLSKGVPLSVHNNMGLTPLDIARLMKCNEIVEILQCS